MDRIKDKYKIISEIGSGGMAKIYLADDLLHDKKVAIKVLSNERIDDEISKKRFESEIKHMMRIESDYVVKFIDYYNNNDFKCIIMEYIDGTPLNDYIKERTNIMVDECVSISKNIALGLDALHNEGIIHRDIKSSNIIIDHNGHAKLIDLGISHTKEYNQSRLTKTNSVIGSVQYLAPEILSDRNPKRQSDIYSLGILMYEMLTGNVPFSGKNPADVLLEHKKNDVPMVNKVFPNIPQSVANIIAKATCKNLTIRYQDAWDLYNDLKTCLNDDRISEKPFSGLKFKQSSFKKSFHDKKLLIYIIIISILIALIIISIILILWVL